MKKYFLACVLLNGLAHGQVSSPKQYSVAPGYSLTDTSKNFNIKERLVQLALNNPAYEVTDRLTNVARYQIKLAKSSWFTSISAQYNANEYTLFPKTTSSSNPIYYPRYNFGVGLPFDIFTRVPNNVKIARENYLIAEANKNDKFRQIKADVLTKYEDYLLSKQKLELQIAIAQDAYTSYILAEDNFKKNIIKADDLTKAYRNWVSEQVAKLDLQRNLNVAKIDLEKIIGVKLDDVLKENY
ncbi:MAG: TolC family protein [Bacteroidetes bacterium]|nr:TolC family protein [Bacteroidota bacterium]MBS1975197.1 TolC family protein [Bacteroidota bacterium]